MSDAQDVNDVLPSSAALEVAAGWLGIPVDDALDEVGHFADGMFDRPRAPGLGLGATNRTRHQAKGPLQALDKRLKQRIERSMVDGELQEGAVAHREHPTGPHGIMAKRVQHRKQDVATARGIAKDEDDESPDSKAVVLASSSLAKRVKQLSTPAARQELLAVPKENLSKWQRKRRRQKERVAARTAEEIS